MKWTNNKWIKIPIDLSSNFEKKCEFYDQLEDIIDVDDHTAVSDSDNEDNVSIKLCISLRCS